MKKKFGAVGRSFPSDVMAEEAKWEEAAQEGKDDHASVIRC